MPMGSDNTWTTAGTVADLNQVISGAYVQAEIQAISDKVDEILAALREANVISE